MVQQETKSKRGRQFPLARQPSKEKRVFYGRGFEEPSLSGWSGEKDVAECQTHIRNLNFQIYFLQFQ